MALCIFCLGALSIAQEGTASLSGRVDDITGKGLAGTLADLHSEKGPSKSYRVVTDDLGMYRFPELFGEAYTLELQQAGFRRLTVKGISVSDGEQKVLPSLRMDVGVMGCSPKAVVDYLRLGGEQGSLTGSVRVEHGPYARNSKPIGNTQVTLICRKGAICGTTKTNSQGEFLFQNLAPGDYSIRANHPGFYPLVEPGYQLQEGLESIYFPIYLERCPLGNCDPRLRPKKPPAVCE